MNPLLSLTALTTPLTMAQIRALMVKSLVALGIRADLWIAGGVSSSILTVAAQIGATASVLIATVISGFFLPLSSGTALQLLAIYGYGVTPPAATFATGKLTLTNTGGGVYTNVPVGSFVVQNLATKQTYTNTTIFTLGSVGTSTDVISIPIQATQQGSIGNAIPGAITVQITPLLGVTVSNPSSVIGIDAISDSALQQLCLNALGARSVRGPRTAYGYAAQTAINAVTGQPVNINRWTISESSHTGTVTLYVAAPSGVPDPNDVAGVVTSIEAVARPNAVRAIVIAASAVPDNDILTVQCLAPTGTTSAALQTAVQNGLGTFFENYPIGGITATDVNGTITGLLAPAVIANIGASLTAAGAQLISVSGYTDYTLPPQGVATNSTTVFIRIIASPLGTTVSTD
jgi:hypothetical protein